MIYKDLARNALNHVLISDLLQIKRARFIAEL